MALVTTSATILAFKASPLWALVVGTARLERGRHVAEAASRLNIADVRLLWLLCSEGARTMKEISDALGLEQSTVNRQVNAALKHGFVERVEPDADAAAAGRARLIRATEEGEQVFARDLEAGMDVFGVALDAIPADERERFMTHYAAFAEAYRVEALRASARFRG
ncbi:MarR family transcriptional regulator [Nocardioides yefusunii]|uniref:MarR family transcriptional regulator n=1 Tax=Nocardioides yefusunii TaxID=2500546 RepID=A0ABW1QWW5_9ACTN|nr:MarR family transcriptional regulator [Nocardioides yefusunii]